MTVTAFLLIRVLDLYDTMVVDLRAVTALGTTILFLVPGAAFAQTAYDWTGPYVGATLGVVVSGGTATTDKNHEFIFSSRGALAGVTAGYNVQINDFVIGIETDGSLVSLEGENINNVNLASADERLEALLTLRGRLGVTHGPVLAYGTLGLAGGSAGHSASVSALFTSYTPVPAEASGFVAGIVGGAGVEVAVNKSVSLKAEGLMYQLSPLTGVGDNGKGALNDGTFKSEHVPSGLVVRTGVNFHF